MTIHLRGGQTDARGGIHGFSHIGGELSQCFIDFFDFFCTRVQTGIGILKYGQVRHGNRLEPGKDKICC